MAPIGYHKRPSLPLLLLPQFPDLHALRAYRALCAYMADDWEGSRAEVAQYQVGRRVHGRSVVSTRLQRGRGSGE